MLAAMFASRTLAASLLIAPLLGANAQSTDSPQTFVITATRHALPLVDAPAAMTVVTGEQIAERGADNIFEALRGETGLSLQGRTIGGRTALSLRGMEFRHTLFLVDGKRIGGTDGVVGHSDFQYDWVAAEDIERIEVVRGPMSVLYGSEALGGVVNIITRRPGVAWAFGALAEGRWGDNSLGGDGHRAAMRASGPLAEGLRLAVSMADTRRQSLALKEDPRLTELEGRHKHDGALLLWWAPMPGHEVEFEHRAGQEDRWANMRERSGARRIFESRTPIDRRHGSLAWRATWGGEWHLNSLLRAYESRVDVGNARDNGVAALRPNNFDDRIVEGQLSAQPQSGSFLTGGFEVREEKLFNIGLPGGGDQARHDAVYAQGEFEITPALALTAGLRRDQHERFGNEWSPRAYAVWRVAPDWTVKGGLGHGFKAPSLKQISPDYREDEGPNTYFGNAALRPEKSDAAEIGVGWDTPGAGAQLMLFASHVDDLIVPRLLRQVGTRGEYLFENIDRARFEGLETAFALRLPAGFAVNATYTYLDARDGSGVRLEKRPRHSLGLRLGWRDGPWRAGVDAQYTAGQLLASTTPGQPLQPAPDLTRLSAHVSREVGNGLTLSAGVDNLGQLRLADESPLFTGAEAPRTWRIALRGQW
jgi:outer membrane receptor for ferrienterochelin and colicins